MTVLRLRSLPSDRVRNDCLNAIIRHSFIFVVRSMRSVSNKLMRFACKLCLAVALLLLFSFCVFSLPPSPSLFRFLPLSRWRNENCCPNDSMQDQQMISIPPCVMCCNIRAQWKCFCLSVRLGGATLKPMQGISLQDL